MIADDSPDLFSSRVGLTMALHPQAKLLLEASSSMPSLDFSTLTAAELRRVFAPPKSDAPSRELARVEDREIPGPAGPMTIRVYSPTDEHPVPVTLYLFGGGFVIGDLDTTDAICRSLAVASESAVVSVGYRRAPEAPFPAGLLDAQAALHWVHANAAQLGFLPDKIAVAGDSSGGNFAAALAQAARFGGPRLCHQLLMYAPLDHECGSGSWSEFAEGYLLTAELMRWYWRQYLSDPSEPGDVRASPLKEQDLTGVAPATIFTAEFDVLRDEGEAYAAALSEAGVPVDVKRWLGQIHGFLLQTGVNPDADAAIELGGKALLQAFTTANSDTTTSGEIHVP